MQPAISRHVWPDRHWNWPIRITHKHGVRNGSMIWVGGQVDLTPEGEVRNPGDLSTQIVNVVANLARVLDALGGDLEDLVVLNCFYVDEGGIGEHGFLSRVAACLPSRARVAITAVPLPALAYPGMVVEIEAYAMRAESGERMTRTHARHGGPAGELANESVPESASESATESASESECESGRAAGGAGTPRPVAAVPTVRCGKMIYVAAQGPEDDAGQVLHPGDIVAQTRVVMARIESLLAEHGAGLGDVVKLNRWYAGDVGVEDFEPAALACAACFEEPGPAATGIPIPAHADRNVTIKIAAIAMLGEDGQSLPRRHVWPNSLWDWHVHLPYKHGLRCEDMIFIGGQVALDQSGRAVHPGDLTAQTHQAMRHIGTVLEALGAGYDDVCKVLTFYRGDCGAKALHANLPARSGYFEEPGPATTGVPFPVLAYDAMMVEIDVLAMCPVPGPDCAGVGVGPGPGSVEPGPD